ncbi:MAG: HesA/MoeB/ThiF family protein [Flavobacteriales bacterium]|nr:HesA/MoeB/ThiF family protein [Flavobacteriales bacterium]
MRHKQNMGRYDRQITLAQVGFDGQARLRQARVLVVGAGGLGCPALQYLVAAGVGCIGIMDGDSVTISNLHRQPLFNAGDVGRKKAIIAAERLGAQNPEPGISALPYHLSPANALETISCYDLVLDCTDDIPTRYLVNDACVHADKPFVHGSIHRFEGQVSVFNHSNGPTYRCLFPDQPEREQVPSCAASGVLGVVPGTIGCLQATEALKVLLGMEGILRGKLLIQDLIGQSARTISFQRNPEQVGIAMRRDLSSPQGEVPACNVPGADVITVEELHHALERNAPWQFLDVRDQHEEPRVENLQGHHIPVHELTTRMGELDPDRPILVYCQSGTRSTLAVKVLREQGMIDVLSLEGGVLAWISEFPGTEPVDHVNYRKDHRAEEYLHRRSDRA